MRFRRGQSYFAMDSDSEEEPAVAYEDLPQVALNENHRARPSFQFYCIAAGHTVGKDCAMDMRSVLLVFFPVLLPT